MKKFVIIVIVAIVVIGGGAWYLLSGADEFIRAQIEKQGSRYLDTTVSVSGVSLDLREGRLEINEFEVLNPEGFSDEDALSVDKITLDLGAAVTEPYRVQEIRIDAPEVLYEVDTAGRGNLIVLKNSLQAQLPKGEEHSNKNENAPLLIVDKVTVSNVKLRIDFENLQTGNLKLEKTKYAVTLPTFNAGPIGLPDGLPADQVGIAIINSMLDDIIAKAKTEMKKALKDKAKEKLDEKINELLDKVGNKLKS